jgi:hypothetical protein
MAVRRARGALLRLVRRRSVAFVVGVALAVPAVWLEFHSDRWWVDGVSLILAATGAALIWTAVAGLKPDWVD